MKMSAATIPTKNAATSSMKSIKRSMMLRLRGAAGKPTAESRPPPDMIDLFRCQPKRGNAELSRRTAIKTAAAKARRRRLGGPPRLSIRRIVLRQGRLEVLHDSVRIAAGLLHALGPCRRHRLGGFFPFGKLLSCQRIDVVAFGLELGD